MRYDFWRTITELFVESYSKQIGKWCKEHNIIFTGHYLYENEFPQSIIASGAIMPHYQYQGIPGIDILTESIRETLTVKQCSSIVNQFRKKRLISELYGCTGWEFTFEGQKWVGDWQYALGVNLRCQHLALYSLRGCRKRDYPPSFNYNTTWWKYNKVIEDYFARLSFILSEGEVVREILLIHPIESAWMIFNGSNIEEVSSIGRGLQEIADTLLALHRDFDLGDESIIENYGKVFGSEFVVNEASYKLVILPPMKTIRASTVKLLKEFLDSGGKIISVTPHPDMVEAKREDLSELFTHPNVFILTDRNKLGDTIDNDIFFIVNIDRENSHMVEIIINNRGKVEEWDALTGDIKEVYPDYDTGKIKINVIFGPAESKIYVIDPKVEPERKNPPVKHYKKSLYIGPVTPFKRTDPNILVLDFCQYRLKGEEWSGLFPVWRAQQEIRNKLGMRDIHVNGIEQRWRWVDKPHPNDGTPYRI